MWNILIFWPPLKMINDHPTLCKESHISLHFPSLSFPGKGLRNGMSDEWKVNTHDCQKTREKKTGGQKVALYVSSLQRVQFFHLTIFTPSSNHEKLGIDHILSPHELRTVKILITSCYTRLPAIRCLSGAWCWDLPKSASEAFQLGSRAAGGFQSQRGGKVLE